MNRYDDLELSFVRDALRSQELSGFYADVRGGKYVQLLEESFGKLMGISPQITVSVSNGTSAIYCALLALGVKPGDTVITTPLTFVGTATPILQIGAKPAFCDVGGETWTLWLHELDRIPSEEAKGVIFVPLLGNASYTRDIRDICDKKGWFLIEDCAQALGSEDEYANMAGMQGDVATFSFQSTKTLSCGEGGMTISKDLEISDKIRAIRNHGNKYHNYTESVCGNFRLSELQAAVAYAQMQKLQMFNTMQRTNHTRLVRELNISEHYYLEPQRDEGNSVSFISGFTIDKNVSVHPGLLGHLTSIWEPTPGLAISGGYTELVSDLSIFQKYKQYPKGLPVAHDLIKRFLWFDVGRFKTDIEMDAIIEKILGALK